jgi:type IV pilus assembly protein PilA
MRRHRKSGSGFSLIELLIVITIILIIAAIAIPKLLTVKQVANATAAVANVRSLTNALEAYDTAYPTVGYPTALANLAGTGMTPTSTAALLVDASLITNPKQGYNFTYVPATCAPGCSTFTLNADPASFGVATRHLYSDQTGVIRYNDKASATATDLAIE